MTPPGQALAGTPYRFSTLSVGETELAVTRGVTMTGSRPPFIRDAVALHAALSRITELARRKDAPTDTLQLSEIRSLLPGDHPAAGSFRRERVAIRGSSHTPPKTWEAVMQQMEQWEQWSAGNSGLPAPLRAATSNHWLCSKSHCGSLPRACSTGWPLPCRTPEAGVA